MKCDRKRLFVRFKTIFSFGCFVLAAYMTISQVIRYIENKNMSSITNKNFNEHPDNKYPTFSICLKGEEIYWKVENYMFEQTGVTSAQYVDLLKGKGWRYEYDEITGLYGKEPLNESSISGFGTQYAFLKPSDIIVGTQFLSRSFDHFTDAIDTNNGFGEHGANLPRIPFHLGYRAPNEFCFTRNSSDKLGLIRISDQIQLNESLLDQGNHLNLKLGIYFHYPGQLIEQLIRPALQFTLKEQYINVDLRILQVSVLKNRHDSNSPCYNGVLDDDTRYLQEIVKRIRCLPIHWKNLQIGSSKYPLCNSNKDYEELQKLVSSYEKVSSTYPRSCTSMETLVTKTKTRGLDGRKQIKIEVSYPYQASYQETENVMEFTFESFFSGVGGFVGIFLGYSILQIPDFINNILVSKKAEAFCISR